MVILTHCIKFIGVYVEGDQINMENDTVALVATTCIPLMLKSMLD